MARLLRMVTGLASDRITFNPQFNTANFGTITTTGYTLPGFLTLQLANRCDKVEVEGQATFIFTPEELTLVTDSFGVQIDIYSNGTLVYTTQSLLTGLAITASTDYIWTVPIKFDENPSLTSVQDTVVYTAVITRIGTPTTNGTIVVVQGSIEAEEVASDNNCFPGCGYIPKTVQP